MSCTGFRFLYLFVYVKWVALPFHVCISVEFFYRSRRVGFPNPSFGHKIQDFGRHSFFFPLWQGINCQKSVFFVTLFQVSCSSNCGLSISKFLLLRFVFSSLRPGGYHQMQINSKKLMYTILKNN